MSFIFVANVTEEYYIMFFKYLKGFIHDFPLRKYSSQIWPYESTPLPLGCNLGYSFYCIVSTNQAGRVLGLEFPLMIAKWAESVFYYYYKSSTNPGGFYNWLCYKQGYHMTKEVTSTVGER